VSDRELTLRQLDYCLVRYKYKEVPSDIQDCINNGSAADIRKLIRRINLRNNRIELNDKLKTVITHKEREFAIIISQATEDKKKHIRGLSYHKSCLVYYGMVYRILEWFGCYLYGKDETSPIGITHSRFCQELSLQDRLGTKNLRKSINSEKYGFNYQRRILEAGNGKNKENEFKMRDPEHYALEPVYLKLSEFFEEYFRSN